MMGRTGYKRWLVEFLQSSFIQLAREELYREQNDSDTVASPSPRAENEPRGQNELSRKQKTNHSKSGLGLPSIVALVMVIDKSWTSLGKHEKAFYTGLKKFVDDCKPLVDSAGNIRCPCKSCRLVLWVSIKHLSDHISKYGFDPSYKTWIHHGEPDLPSPPPVIDNTRQPQSDMTTYLNDLSYIPLNNVQNEPTQGDIGKTSNDPTQAKNNEFEELYASANEELYPGCDYVTRLYFMAKFTYFKVKGKLTNSIFNEMLEFFQNVFPTAKGYNLPPSYYAIKKTFKMIGLGYESIHACVNDCFLFQGDANKDVHFCLVCNTSRWKDSNKPGKKVPKKVLRYFLIIPRLQRLNKSSYTAKEMTWHATGKCMEPSNDPGVSESSEIFALACGPSQTPISVNFCVVNGVRFVVHSHDERRTTQNSGICSPGPDGEIYYGQLKQILEFSYLSFKIVLFRVKWFDTSNKGRIQNFVIRNNITQIKANGEVFKNDQYILATQVKQCFYLEDMARRPLGWKVIEHVSHKKFSNRGVIVVEDDPDVIHVDNSSDPTLSTSLNDLEIASLHIDGQSIDVDAPPDIIDVDEDDDIIDEEDLIPHDLADFDDEASSTLILMMMSADVARGHGDDGGGDDRPPPYQIPTGCGGFLDNRGKGTRKPNLGGRRAGRMHTRQETRNLGLKAITDKNGPVPIRFEFGDRETLVPLGDHATHSSNYLGELVRELSLHYPSWRQIPSERKAGVVAKIETQFDLRPHMESDRWPKTYAGIQQHLLPFGMIPRTLPGLLKINKTGQRAWSPRLSSGIKKMESSATREYPSLIHTFFLTHIVGGVFLNPQDKALYDEMLRLQGLGSNTPSGVPYTDDEIMAIAHGGKQRGHIPGVGRVLLGQGTIIPPPPPCTHTSDVVKLKKSKKRLTHQVNMFMKLFRSDDKFSQMLTQLESQPEYGGGSGSGGYGDDEPGDDENGGRKRRMRRIPIVRRCWVNIDLYLADNASFVTSLFPGDMSPEIAITKGQNLFLALTSQRIRNIFPGDMSPGILHFTGQSTEIHITSIQTNNLYFTGQSTVIQITSIRTNNLACTDGSQESERAELTAERQRAESTAKLRMERTNLGNSPTANIRGK
ncbi:reverse transcriptase domain-containing protein [Tanacetum coccineum]